MYPINQEVVKYKILLQSNIFLDFEPTDETAPHVAGN